MVPTATLVFAVALVVMPTEARVAVADGAERAVFVGVDLRSDLGTHVFRLSGGARRGRLSATLVLDPHGYVDDTQRDTDLLVERELGRTGWALLAGWRFESNPVLGVRYYHQKPLIGVSAAMPALLFGVVRARFTGELALTLVEHGAHLPTVWCWEQDEALRGTLDLGFTLRLEYARGL